MQKNTVTCPLTNFQNKKENYLIVLAAYPYYINELTIQFLQKLLFGPLNISINQFNIQCSDQNFNYSLFTYFWPRRLACAMRACVRHA